MRLWIQTYVTTRIIHAIVHFYSAWAVLLNLDVQYISCSYISDSTSCAECQHIWKVEHFLLRGILLSSFTWTGHEAGLLHLLLDPTPQFVSTQLISHRPRRRLQAGAPVDHAGQVPLTKPLTTLCTLHTQSLPTCCWCFLTLIIGTLWGVSPHSKMDLGSIPGLS